MQNRTSIPYLIVLSIVALCGAGTAAAQDTDRSARGGEKLREKFSAADVDHDGFLSRDEAAKGMPHVAKHFDEIDADHNGKVSLQEVASFLKAKRQARSS